ncbi:M23 family metallopeptidase [Fervidobacterium thailandense]|uniref:Peptidase M23 n=1 Tax=Fervidobacterium thailandense TaxID=1008305 RepID=A0A1E3G1T8_9BACT|nr:M23 family metallopeptidase [Fervidobacterium thailandense]ODN30216.1 peptidase M23 [Fervidobacterium thailandense]
MELRTWLKPLIVVPLLLIVLGLVRTTFAQFEPPVNNSYVTATFMEFRSTGNVPHFHAGVDFSTFLREGIEIRAAADGYLVRLEIDEGGIYGNTIVLQHENGYRTLYAHLQRFAEKTDFIVNMLRSEFGNQRIVVEFLSDDVKFQRGEVVGYSGKTGEATQPHAHFEVRDKDEKYVYDPLRFIDVKRLKPVQMGIVLKSLLISDKEYQYSPGAVYTFNGDYPKISVEAYTELAKNLLGVKEIKLYFSNELVYHIILDEIPLDFYEKPYTVYHEKTTMTSLIYKAFYKLYSDEELPFVKVNRVGEFKRLTYDVKVEISDVFGNSGVFTFTLKRG